MWRIKALIFLIVCLVGSVQLQAQDQKKLNTPITISTKLIRFDYLQQELTKATGLSFSYNPGVIEPTFKLRVPKTTLSVAEWLNILRKELAIETRVVGGHIILKKATRSPIGKTKPVQAKEIKKYKATPLTAGRLSQPPVTRKRGEPVSKTIETVTVEPNAIPEKGIDLPNAISEKGIDFISSNYTKPNYTGDSVKPLSTDLAENRSIDTIAKINKESKLRSGVKNVSKLQIGLQGFSFAYERKLTKQITVDLSGGIGGIYRISDRPKYNFGIYSLGLHIAVNPRWYYNNVKADRLGNNGAYIGASARYVHDLGMVDFVGSSFLIDMHWGIQKSISNRIFINAHAGPGFAFHAVNSAPFPRNVFYPSLNFKIGYLLHSSR